MSLDDRTLILFAEGVPLTVPELVARAGLTTIQVKKTIRRHIEHGRIQPVGRRVRLMQYAATQAGIAQAPQRPESTVQFSCRTQPTSVFDLARVQKIT